MDKKRKVYAPFSQTSEAGVAQTPVEGYIDVNQTIYPIVNTGVVNENGQWAGVKSSDTEFFAFTKAVAVANGGAMLSPDTGTINHIDMTGFNDLFFAIKPTAGGNCAIQAVMGPDTNRYANLAPVNAAALLRGSDSRFDSTAIQNLLDDSTDAVTADVWNIFSFNGQIFANQKNLQMKVVNNTGQQADFEFAFMRLV